MGCHARIGIGQLNKGLMYQQKGLRLLASICQIEDLACTEKLSCGIVRVAEKEQLGLGKIGIC